MRAPQTSTRRFVHHEDGGGTVMSLFIVIILAMLLGIALDATNGWRNRTYLSSAADMGICLRSRSVESPRRRSSAN